MVQSKKRLQYLEGFKKTQEKDHTSWIQLTLLIHCKVAVWDNKKIDLSKKKVFCCKSDVHLLHPILTSDQGVDDLHDPLTGQVVLSDTQVVLSVEDSMGDVGGQVEGLTRA